MTRHGPSVISLARAASRDIINLVLIAILAGHGSLPPGQTLPANTADQHQYGQLATNSSRQDHTSELARLNPKPKSP